MTEESLKILLANLSSNPNEAAAAYTNLRNSLVRFFQLKGDFDADEAADSTLDRVALKLSQSTEVTNVTSYGFGVARLIFLERLRISEKNKKAHDGFYNDQKRDEADNYSVFRECFEKLQQKEKEILEDYFADMPSSDLMIYREKLSAKYDISLNNLRIKVFRLRRRLDDCLKQKLL
jgi:DNA-directed RNA polymerase specialized sigma24 family protein